MRRKTTQRTAAGGGSARFPDGVLVTIRERRGIRIRAGTGPHRFIGIWAVIVERRVFVRSWSVKPRNWYRMFLEDPVGAIQIGGQELAVRARRTRSARLNDAIDRGNTAK